MKQLGGDQQSKLFTPKAIKELFQVSFFEIPYSGEE